MLKIIGILLLVIALVAGLTQAAGYGFAYTVDEREFVVITQFGQVQREVVTPGLKFKSPVQTVVRFDRRLLRIDVPVASMPDRDSQFLEIDAYVRYRITNPTLFLESLRDETNASRRIGDLAVSAIRDEVGVRDRRDIIGGDPITQDDGTIVVRPRQTTDGVPSREAMMQLALNSVREDTQGQQWGVEVVDIRIKRADFPTAAEASVFDRMRTERSVQAQRLRAEGEEQYLTMTADVDRQVRVIRVEAERDANILSGEGEAQAVQIFARVLGTTALSPAALDALDALESLEPSVLDELNEVNDDLLSGSTEAQLRAGNILGAGALSEVIDSMQGLSDADFAALEEALGSERADALRGLRAAGEGALEPLDVDALAEALEFFAFRRSLEAYANFLNDQTTLVLSSDSDLFRYLEGYGRVEADSESSP